MTTKRILCFHDSRIGHPERFGHQVAALNRWMTRSNLDITFELLGQPFSGSQFSINPIQVAPAMAWDTMAINYQWAAEDNLSPGSVGCDGNTGFPVIVGLRLADFAEPGTLRFNHQTRHLAHEMQHIYSPLEGYHLLTRSDHPPEGRADLSWSWRADDEDKRDTGGIFRRNPGLRHDPAVELYADFELATMSEFSRQLWLHNVRQPWAWSKREWFNPTVWTSDKPDLPVILDTGREGRYLIHRESSQVFDITEFLLHDLINNRMTLPVVLPEKPVLFPPTIDKPPIVINPAPATQPLQLANMREALLKSRQLAGSLVLQLVALDEALQALEGNQDKLTTP